MTTFDTREKAFEDKFAHDADLKFKAVARANKLVGQWAAGKLGLTGGAADDYGKAVCKADLAGGKSDPVFGKIKADFAASRVGVSDDVLHQTMSEFLAKAVNEVERGV